MDNNSFGVTIALLLGVIAGLIATWLTRSQGASWQAAICVGAGAFAGTVFLVLEIQDHL